MFDGPHAPELSPAERRARLRLARSARIGPVLFHHALQHFGSARRACAEVAAAPEAEIAREEANLRRAGGQFLVIGDRAYPQALAAIPDAPPVLSAIGDLGLLARPALAMVGAREASLAGCRLAAELASGIGAAGFVVASGLARGIDAAAHSAALATGTVAVLAGGIDQIYPLQNARLHADIARGGLLLSEMPWGIPPVARSFPRRNRIVSGLSSGVVVIEAAARSGSMITARLAAEQGRDVFVLPGSPADPHYDGSNSLIHDGAILVRHANDILRALERPAIASQPLGESGRKRAEPGVAKVLAALGSVPTAVDELVRRCQVSAAAMAEVLLALELEGRLERHRGNRVSLI
ncbi:DNA-processing protein DprA [Reyranella sp.]|uniref:DNA-processing protein DprA n=1 Tax=Reyranella sp. TaxID=1929291 RepID=UPI003785168F